MNYQRALRVLGTHLDQAGAEDMRIMEHGHALAVQYWSAAKQGFTEYEALSLPQLLELEKEQVKEREQGGAAGKYQDLLRTVGWELDQVGARGILLDEHDHGMVVTFQFLVPSDGFLPHKTAWHLAGDEQQVILGRAFSRRQVETPAQKRRLRDFFA